jgi:hypothetical protein
MLLGHGQQGLCLHRLPRLIHQTVVNKSRLSCEEKRVIASWKKLNPDYTHYLWDDQDMRKFMLQVSDSSASSCMHPVNSHWHLLAQTWQGACTA